MRLLAGITADNFDYLAAVQKSKKSVIIGSEVIAAKIYNRQKCSTFDALEVKDTHIQYPASF